MRIILTFGIVLAMTSFSLAQGEVKMKSLIVCLISGSAEYESDKSLSSLQQTLEKKHPIQFTRAFLKSENDLPGLENLDSCDVAVFFTRRLKINGEQLDRVKNYCLAGKPIVGIRTASHGFQNWLEMDKELFGGNYKNHYKEGPLTEVKMTASGAKHPILNNVKAYSSKGSLYKNPDIAKDTQVLLTGTIPSGETEPIAWTREFKGARIFYTSLGHQKDFEDPNFVELITNALYWTAKRN